MLKNCVENNPNSVEYLLVLMFSSVEQSRMGLELRCLKD